jgi:hypothetical protein
MSANSLALGPGAELRQAIPGDRDGRQVFVDPSGRRARRLRAGARLVGCLGVMWMSGLALGSLMWAPFPALASQLDSARSVAPRPAVSPRAPTWPQRGLDLARRAPATAVASTRG